jgi:hypothetical protein
MSTSTRKHSVVTSHGSLAVEESGQGGKTVLLMAQGFVSSPHAGWQAGRICRKPTLTALSRPSLATPRSHSSLRPWPAPTVVPAKCCSRPRAPAKASTSE